DGKIGVYDYRFASQCVAYLLELLKNGASGLMEWEGYDSYYEHHYPSLFSYWGILGYDSSAKIYTPRKHFYAIRQITDYVTPGSYRLECNGGDSIHTVAFYDTVKNKIIIAGINPYHHPLELNGAIANMQVSNMEMTFTDSSRNQEKNDISLDQNKFNTTIPANCIFTINAGISKIKTQPVGWYSGDIHVHRNCGSDSVLNESILSDKMKENDLDVISVLADMGNGEVKDAKTDLQKITGADASQSQKNRIIHWDAEWHWDATYSNFNHQALGGHLVLLGLKNASQMWEESPHKILEWAKAQGAARGFCHMEYLNDSIQNELNCCIPIDYPVEAVLGNIDFISEDVYGTDSPNNGNYNSEAAMNAYYKLLNCGIRLGLAAGTDYPCNDYEPFGKLLTYVKTGNNLTYNKWVDGIKKGRTVVSRTGNNEFLQLKINGSSEPGDEISLPTGKQMDISVTWTSSIPVNGIIELVCNGKVIASHTGYCSPRKPVTFKTKHTVSQSSWIIARRMYKGEHQSHTAPVYITVNKKPVRAAADDAMYFVKWIDNILTNISPGGKWSSYYTKNVDSIKARYLAARNIYRKIASECIKEQHAPVLILSQQGNYIEEIMKAEGLNSFVSRTINDLSGIDDYNIVILPVMPITSSQSEILKKYVRAGGNLIAFRPDTNLSSIFSLRQSNDTITDPYISIGPENETGKGLTTEALQVHGIAQACSSANAKVIASFNNKYPAVTINKFGKGTAVAFTYDLPMSIILTRQGNYKNAGLEKDGIKGLRAMDLFTDGWLDTTKNIYNQADEQMRLLSRIIRTIAGKPLPSFWYFPDTLNALVTLTNDGEYSDEKDIDTQLRDIEEKNASMSLYILTAGKISLSSTEAWQKRGNEISGHPDNTLNAEHPTWQNMDTAIEFKLKELSEKYSVPAMNTVVNHWFVWNGLTRKGSSDFTAQAQIEKMHGIGMDINYAHYDNHSPQQHFLGPMGTSQGNFTGSGLPMKFGDMNGKVIDIYQHVNNVYDQQYMEHKDSIGFFDSFKGLLDRSLYNQVYSYISVKSHNDEYYFSKKPLLKMLDYANSRRIPVWTPVKLLEFLKAKDQATFDNVKWAASTLSFNIHSDLQHQNMLSVIVPYIFDGKKIVAITSGSAAKAYAVKKIKGLDYAIFSIRPGTAYHIVVKYAK
ncbi:MAG TPA: CehA/McbA family metallohydrolase, partial [Flavitalea sp.]|nr:CehA/McbA family metallohydrolase [Flavitalea sp.]